MTQALPEKSRQTSARGTPAQAFVIVADARNRLPNLHRVDELRGRGVGFRSICDGVFDTTSASGELVFNMFSALAQFERRLIQERTKAGLAAARARGRVGGRPAVQSNAPRVLMAKAMHRDRSFEIKDICRSLKISRSTLYRYLNLRPDA